MDAAGLPNKLSRVVVGGWVVVAGLTKNIANSAFQLKLELGLRLSLAILEKFRKRLFVGTVPTKKDKNVSF